MLRKAMKYSSQWMVNRGKRLGRNEFCGSSTQEGGGTGRVKQDTFLSAHSTLCLLLQVYFCPCAVGWRLIHLVFCLFCQKRLFIPLFIEVDYFPGSHAKHKAGLEDKQSGQYHRHPQFTVSAGLCSKTCFSQKIYVLTRTEIVFIQKLP